MCFPNDRRLLVILWRGQANIDIVRIIGFNGLRILSLFSFQWQTLAEFLSLLSKGQFDPAM